MDRRKSILILLIALAFICSACSGSRHLTSGRYAYGNASWYGKPFHGRKTASGERYNMHAKTAAHKKLPFGTKLEVTYLKTGKKVKVRINDRGPFIHGRKLDLSYGAAKRIGLVRDGVGKVRMRIIR